MTTKMRKLLEQVAIKEADFKGDDGVSHVPAPEFSGSAPTTDLKQAADGKSKDAKNSDLKGKLKDEPKKLNVKDVLLGEEGMTVEEQAEAWALYGEEVKTELDEGATPQEKALADKIDAVKANIAYYTKNEKGKSSKSRDATLKDLQVKLADLEKDYSRFKKPKTELKNSYEVSRENLDLSEDLNALIGGESDDLSEEFKTKVKTIYETAVITKSNEVIATVVEEVKAVLAEETAAIESKFEEEFKVKVAELEENMEKYTAKAIEEWKEENAVAIQSSIRTEIAESFMAGLKTLFETHYIDVPEGKVDVVEGLMARTTELEEKLEKEMEKNIALKEEIQNSSKEKLKESVAEDLSDTQKDKFVALTENIDFTTEAEYVTKLTEIKEAYFTKAAVKVNAIEESDDGIDLKEEVKNWQDPAVKYVADLLSKQFGKK